MTEAFAVDAAISRLVRTPRNVDGFVLACGFALGCGAVVPRRPVPNVGGMSVIMPAPSH
jgi:hypothetical protein